LASIATSETAMLRLRDRYQKVLTITAVREGVNDAELLELGEADEFAGCPFEMARRVWEMARSVWADVSAGSC
jgi:hypothetical protein